MNFHPCGCALTRALKIMSEVIVHYPFMTCRQSLELPKLPNDVRRARRPALCYGSVKDTAG
jgi:hypothetical protein